jgi:surfactin synthase thioesterase subunit
MVPVADVPRQNVEPWQHALERLTADSAHYDDLSRRSREAALAYVENLSVLPFENYLQQLVATPRQEKSAGGGTHLSEEKRKLLALRLRKRTAVAPAYPWVSGIEEAVAGKLIVFCFPYAGAGALVYRAWRERLRGTATVCGIGLPGRESRLNERPFDSMEDLAPALAAGLLPVLREPFAFFGHSMGAGIAFEVTRWLRRNGHLLPRSLHVSAARAPQDRTKFPAAPDPTNEELLNQLRRLRGISSHILEKPELLEIAMTSLRADTRMYRRYRYTAEEPLAVPLFAYSGTADPSITPEQMEAWRAQTSVLFERREFPGGHFYIDSERDAFLDALGEDLTRV